MNYNTKCCDKIMDMVEGTYVKINTIATFKLKCSVCGKTKVSSHILQERNKRKHK